MRHPVVMIMLLVLLSVSCGDGRAQDIAPAEVLRLGILPDDASDAVRDRYDPLAQHLEDELDVEVVLVVPQSYEHLTAEFADGSVDVAVFGGVSFLRAHDESGAEALVMRDIDARFVTAFIARADDAGDALPDFVGRRLAFGSELSTSGHLMPRYFLRDVYGLVPEADFATLTYTGTHGATVQAVADGTADLGAVNLHVYEDVIRTGRLPEDALRLVWLTPPYVDYVWAVQPSFDASLRADVRRTLLSLSPSDEAGEAILTPLGSRGFIPASHADFTNLRAIATDLGLVGANP